MSYIQNFLISDMWFTVNTLVQSCMLCSVLVGTLFWLYPRTEKSDNSNASRILCHPIENGSLRRASGEGSFIGDRGRHVKKGSGYRRLSP